MDRESFAATKEPLDVEMKDSTVCIDWVYYYPDMRYGGIGFRPIQCGENMFSKEVLSIIPHNFCNIGCIPTIEDGLKHTDPETYISLRLHALTGARFIREVVKRQGEFWYFELFPGKQAIEHMDAVELTVDDLRAEDLDRNLLKIEEGALYKFVG
ncbi:MAG: hypothetical protein LBT41_06370 [Candidatus Methanoplasma sp.]|jgi:hypothetical protein|nr:hypothetical protein [Candidatus Methanoplasma sp.]